MTEESPGREAEKTTAAEAVAGTGGRLFAILGLLSLIAFARSAAVLNINAAEYTDGVLIAGREYFGPTFWPIGYTWACEFFALFAGGNLEQGGRLASAVFGALAVFPIGWLAAWMLGRPIADYARRRRELAALLAGLFYVTSPIAWRWSIRLMTDAMFLPFFWGSLALLAAAWSSWSDHQPRRTSARTLWFFAGANALGIASAFVRNQGIFLVPAIGLALLGWLTRTLKAKKDDTGSIAAGPIPVTAAILSILLWLIWPAMQWAQAGAHLGQVAYRTGEQIQTGPGRPLLEATMQVWAMLEAFIYLAPYFFTPLLLLLAFMGLFRSRAHPARRTPAMTISLLVVALILVSQAFFQSFLARYLLPILPVVCIWAGLGAERVVARRPRAGWTVAGAAIVYGLFFGGASIYLQRGTFGDIAQAAVALRQLPPLDAPVFSNEVYKPEAGMGSIKLEWWSGRPVRTFDEIPDAVPGGTLFVISSAYGGPEYYRAAQASLQQRLGAQVVAGPFESWLVPLLPDIMQSPRLGHQSPLAWIYRFAPQQFQTVILQAP